MKCYNKDCDGELMSLRGIKSEGKFTFNHKYVEVPKYCILRARKCNKCGAIFKTFELPVERFYANFDFMNDIKNALLKLKERTNSLER